MKRSLSIKTWREHNALVDNANMSTCRPYVFTSAQDEQMLATHGKTFHFAARFFPRAVRPAMVTLYAFFRTLDDLVDERVPGWQAETVRQELDAWNVWFQGGCTSTAPREPLGTSLATVLTTAHIPIQLFEDFLQGLLSDLEPRVFATFHDLSLYCYQVAGTVGIAMAHLLETRSELALSAARQLGIAMQLTNILRDVGSDLAAGRIYLPKDELERAGLSFEQLVQLFQARQGPDERFRAFMRLQMTRARSLYAVGLQGCWLLPPDCRVPILLAGRLYQRILTQIELRHYDVFRTRAATSLSTKLREAGIVYVLAALWRSGEKPISFEEELI